MQGVLSKFTVDEGLASVKAEQVAFDPIAWSYDSSPYVLDSSGKVWQPTGAGYSSLTLNKCGGGTLSIIQIAVKNGVVFALGSGGTVWALYASCGWSQVGTKTSFANGIAADNGNTTAVWASDSSGHVWTAE